MTDTKAQQLHIQARVTMALAGQRVDQAAAALFADYSRGRLQKWIRGGQLTVDGIQRKATFRLAGTEQLELRAELIPEGVVTPQDLPLDVLHHDEDILVLNKAAGMVVHPAAGNPDGTLQNALLFHFPELDALPRSGIVHRLDKDTSGIMVVATSHRAHSSLVDQLQQRSMSRIYRAVATGLTEKRGTVDAPIGRHPRDRIRMAVVAGGKPAVTHYRRLQSVGECSELEVSLESGRTHQIRVHMNHIGHPLLGDPTYGKASTLMDRQALHAWRLQLLHPGSGVRCRFETPLPEDYSRLLNALADSACRH